MISKNIWVAVTTIAAIVGSALAVDARFEKSASATSSHELLAADQEAGRLDNERQLIELELKMLESKVDKSDADQSRIEYLKQRRILIEQRLLDTTKKS